MEDVESSNLVQNIVVFPNILVNSGNLDLNNLLTTEIINQDYEEHVKDHASFSMKCMVFSAEI